MKKILIATMIFLGGVNFTSVVHAEETTVEKVEVKANNTKRFIKKKYHRVKEKLCKRSDYDCLRKKANNRAEEEKDVVKDKKKEIQNKINN